MYGKHPVLLLASSRGSGAARDDGSPRRDQEELGRSENDNDDSDNDKDDDDCYYLH